MRRRPVLRSVRTAALLAPLLVTACTEEDAEQFAEELGEALGRLILIAFAVLLVLVTLLVIGVWLLVGGLRRLRETRAGGGEGDAPAVDRKAWARVVIGGVLVAVVTAPWTDWRNLLLAVAIGTGVWVVAGRGLSAGGGRPAAPVAPVVRILGPAVAVLLIASGLMLFARIDVSSEPSTKGPPVQPSPYDAEVVRSPECGDRDRRAACDRAAEISEKLVYNPVWFPTPIEPTRVRATADGVEATAALTTDGPTHPGQEYAEDFRQDGWQWVDPPPCPEHRMRTPQLCDRFPFTDADGQTVSLTFVRTGRFSEEVKLALVPSGGRQSPFRVEARIVVR